MTGSHYDVIVIGGGPAGSSAARRAAELGARPLLLERHPMPRSKLCGGWVSAHALSLLGFSLPAAIVEHPFTRAHLRFHDDGQTYAPPDTFGVFVDRGRFDAFLLEQARQAGADCEFEAVIDLKIDTRPHVVRTEKHSYTADAVICAVGANSRLTNLLRRAELPSQWAIAVEQQLPIGFANRWEMTPGDAYLHFGAVDFGYAWALHHGAYLLVGVGARRDKVADIRAVLKSLWRQWRLPMELCSCQGHPIPLGGHERTIGKGRVLAVGDAAGMVDPFNGEGIAGAIRSGQLAAESLIETSGFNAASDYKKRLDQELGREMRVARRTAQLFHSLPGSLVRAICSEPQIAEKYNAVLQRRTTYGEFLRALLKRRFWRRTTVPSDTSA